MTGPEVVHPALGEGGGLLKASDTSVVFKRFYNRGIYVSENYLHCGIYICGSVRGSDLFCDGRK
jgi:hypothetical protein